MADTNLPRRAIDIVLLAIIFAVGIFLRITPQAFSPGATLHFLAPLHPQPAWTKIGFDEGLYREYVKALAKDGLSSYPAIVQGYIEIQKELPGSILPPPRYWRWLLFYIIGLTLLVLTKENAFFVWIALVALIITNRWLQFGVITRELLIATILGPLLGVVILIFLAGGIDVFIQSYQLSVGKNFQLRYAILTGDGPWYRYLIDLLLVSPIILLLAIGTIFRLNRAMRPELIMSIFIAASYLVMCNVKYGMNLRYANMWDLPLRVLAFSQIVWLTSFAKRFQTPIVVTAMVFLAAIEFHQYIVLAVRYPLYELINHDLLQALSILKTP